MALPLDTGSTRRAHVRDRRATTGIWLLAAVVMLFAALALAQILD